jgi:poly-gamma-glutamate capsule biosynthesis protein CapA/YwtB (metallophosphatase superfamily)
MKITQNNNKFPGVPEEALIGEWDLTAHSFGKEWRLIVLGDLGLSGKIALECLNKGGIENIFKNIASSFHKADYVMANLETPLLDNWSPDKMFAGNSRWTCGLSQAGIDMLHLASNHMFDHGAQGFIQTIRSVKENGLKIIGAGEKQTDAKRLVVEQFGQIRVGWLAAGHTKIQQPQSPCLWELDINDLITTIKKECIEVDILIVSIHWGSEYIDYPTDEQYQAAHQFIDAGASAVVMHHAHIMQGVEFYSGKPICYNLGNFLFDPNEGLLQQSSNFTPFKYEEQFTGCVFSLTWNDNKFIRLMVAPIVLPRPEQLNTEKFALTWATKDRAEIILYRLARISEDLNGDFSSKTQQQLSELWRWAIGISLNLIFRHHEYWRILDILKRIRTKHFILAGKSLLKLLGKMLHPINHKFTS